MHLYLVNKSTKTTFVYIVTMTENSRRLISRFMQFLMYLKARNVWGDDSFLPRIFTLNVFLIAPNISPIYHRFIRGRNTRLLAEMILHSPERYTKFKLQRMNTKAEKSFLLRNLT